VYALQASPDVEVNMRLLNQASSQSRLYKTIRPALAYFGPPPRAKTL
jgi:hypothetical protein